MGITVHVVYAYHKNICSFSGWLLVSEDFTDENHSLLFALKLARGMAGPTLAVDMHLFTVAYIDPLIGRGDQLM